MKKWREAAAILLGLVLFTVLTYGAGDLLLPVRTSYGATWDRYLLEEPNSLDLLYLGSSAVYCDVIPAVVWEETGLTSYVMAGPEQTLPITYHYLLQACQTQSPQAVVVELNALFFPAYPTKSKPNLLYMPWGTQRLQASLFCTAPENRLEMLFPLYGDHDRVYTVTGEQLEKNLSPQPDPYAGYTLLNKAKPVTKSEERQVDTESASYQRDLHYLRKISNFCAQRDIRLVFYFTPTLFQTPQENRDAIYRDIAAIPHDLFFDCRDGTWPSFDPETGWYDWMHLNVHSAVPFSRRLAAELETLALQPLHGNAGLWQGRYDLIMEQAGRA